MIEFKYISAFLFGVMSSGHCFGMCGGISAAFGISTSASSPVQRLSRLFAYNSGRICCYAALGLLFGFFGQVFVQEFASLMLPLRIFAGLMLIAMACYIGQWWMGITVFERAGQHLWKVIQPVSLRLTPLNSLSSAFGFGVLWGFLPCGLVYSMLVWVSASGDAFSAALLMMCFGIGTLPAMLATGYGSARLKSFLQARAVRQGSAILLLLYGVWTVFSAFVHGH
jgi:sulfite exporter TauE/SafE